MEKGGKNKMKECKKIKLLIQKYLDGELSLQEKSYMDRHLEICTECRLELNYYLKIKENLNYIKPPQLNDRFSVILHSKLLQARYENLIEKKLDSMFLKYAVVGLAIFVIMISVILFKDRKIVFIQQPSYVAYTYGEYNLAGYEVRKDLPLEKEGYIRVKLTSKKEIKNVKIKIELPEGIVSEEGKKVIYWEGDLKPQDNYLTIKVKSSKEGEHPVKIKIKKGSFEKEVVKKVNVIKI